MTRRAPFLRNRAFTLFEVLIALAVFVLAALGIAQAITGTVDAAMAARNHAFFRATLESRLAFCQAFPPKVGEVRRTDASPGFQVQETLEPFIAKDAEGKNVQNVFRLTITASREGSAKETEKMSILLFQPTASGEVQP